MRKIIVFLAVVALLMAAASARSATVDVYKSQEGRWKLRTTADTKGREFDLQDDVGVRVTTRDNEASVLRLTADVGTGAALTLDWWSPDKNDPLYVLEVGMLHRGVLPKDSDGHERLDVIIMCRRDGLPASAPCQVRCIRCYAHYMGRDGEYSKYLVLVIPTCREDMVALFDMEAFYLPCVDVRSNIDPDLYRDRVEKLRAIRAMTCERGGVLKVNGTEVYRSRKGQDK